MAPLMTIALANAVCAALLAVFALLVGRFCRRPAVLHGLWLLVLLKLVTPPLWPITVAHWPEEPAPVVETPAPPAMVSYVMRAEPLPVVQQAPIAWTRAEPMRARLVNPTTAVKIEKAALQDSIWRNVYTVTAPTPKPQSPAAEPQPQGLADCMRWLAIVWLAGAVVWLAWAGLHIGRFHRLLRHARRAGADVQDQARYLAGQMGFQRCPEVWLLPGPLPPLVWAAIGRVRIFFPAKLLDRLDETERASLLAHELARVRRRDHWVRWLELIASGLYWWYPLVWLARRRLHVHEEECCDAWVVGEVPARAYATAILHTLDFLAGDRAPLPVMASGLAGVVMLKRRLSLIMEGGTPKRLGWASRFALLFAGVFLLSVRPDLAQAARKSTEPTPTPTAEARYAILDGKRLATVRRVAALRPWDPAPARPLRVFPGHAGGIWSVRFAPDGKQMASVSDDGIVKLWTLQPVRTSGAVQLRKVP
jgi:beta-lactamase regulating signal transducer with metallopeptidase domain